jgi:hypothetical protein
MTAIKIMPCKKNSGVKKMRIMMILMKLIMKTMTLTRITIKDDNDDKIIIMMTATRPVTYTMTQC